MSVLLVGWLAPGLVEAEGSQCAMISFNPSDPVTRSVLGTVIRTGDYFFLSLDSDCSTTAFRSGVTPNNLIWLKANMARIQASSTTDTQYRQAVSSFARRPDPPGTMLTWVCRNNTDYLDLAEDPLMLRPAPLPS